MTTKKSTYKCPKCKEDVTYEYEISNEVATYLDMDESECKCGHIMKIPRLK